ncbi:MAG: hypothetical protein JKY56_01850, partial [Kofleriaceae bacterium]|nr:hypothetical protein [Kofleriaceae bacterium]
EIVLGEILTLSEISEDAIDPVLVWANSQYRVLWREGDVLMGRTVGVAESVILTDTASGVPAAAWNGKSLVVTWPDNRGAGTGSTALFCAPFDDGYNKEEPETDITAGITGFFQSPAAVQADAQVGLVGIKSLPLSELLFVRLDGNGARIAAPVTVASDALEPSVTFDGSQYSVVWREVTGEQSIILFRQMNAVGMLLAQPINISESDFPSVGPVIVRGGDGFAIVWQELNQPLESSIQLRLVSSTLELGELVELVAPEANASVPAIVRGDSSFGVAWQENRTGQAEVFFREFDFLGNPRGGAVRLSSGDTASNRPSLVYNGERFAASWQTGPTGARVIRFRTIDVP